MRFLSTSPVHLLDKRSNPFRFNVWTAIVPLSLIALAGLIVLGITSYLPRFSTSVETPSTPAPKPEADAHAEILALKDNMARVRLAGLLYAKDHDNTAPLSTEALLGAYLKAVPSIPGFITDKTPATAWAFKGDAVHVSGVKEKACSLINGGVIYSLERPGAQFYCFGDKDNYIAAFQGGATDAAHRGYRLVTAAFSLESFNGVAAVNLQLTGAQDAFVASCPAGALVAPSTTQKSDWVIQSSADGGKYVEQFCIPAVEGSLDAFQAGDTSAKGVNVLSKLINSAGEDWTLFIAGYAIPGCLTSPEKISVVYTAGVAKGKAKSVSLPKGCLPELERPL